MGVLYVKNIIQEEREMALRVKVKSVWQGRVGIRDKYLVRASKEGMEVSCNNASMSLTPEEVMKKIVAKSERPFYDKFSKDYHYLIYYNWVPEPTKQQTLI